MMVAENGVKAICFKCPQFYGVRLTRKRRSFRCPTCGTPFDFDLWPPAEEEVELAEYQRGLGLMVELARKVNRAAAVLRSYLVSRDAIVGADFPPDLKAKILLAYNLAEEERLGERVAISKYFEPNQAFCKEAEELLKIAEGAALKAYGDGG